MKGSKHRARKLSTSQLAEATPCTHCQQKIQSLKLDENQVRICHFSFTSVQKMRIKILLTKISPQFIVINSYFTEYLHGWVRIALSSRTDHHTPQTGSLHYSGTTQSPVHPLQELWAPPFLNKGSTGSPYQSALCTQGSCFCSCWTTRTAKESPRFRKFSGERSGEIHLDVTNIFSVKDKQQPEITATLQKYITTGQTKNFTYQTDGPHTRSVNILGRIFKWPQHLPLTRDLPSAAAKLKAEFLLQHHSGAFSTRQSWAHWQSIPGTAMRSCQPSQEHYLADCIHHALQLVVVSSRCTGHFHTLLCRRKRPNFTWQPAKWHHDSWIITSFYYRTFF